MGYRDGPIWEEEDFQLSVLGGVPIHSDRYHMTGAWVLVGRWL